MKALAFNDRMNDDKQSNPLIPEENNELLPCPFCGNARPEIIETHRGHWKVGCAACGSHNNNSLGRQTAIKAWNTRSVSSVPSGGNQGAALVSEELWSVIQHKSYWYIVVDDQGNKLDCAMASFGYARRICDHRNASVARLQEQVETLTRDLDAIGRAAYGRELRDGDCSLACRMSAFRKQRNASRASNTALREQLATLLDSVDYLAGNCKANSMVGAVLDAAVIRNARAALASPNVGKKA